MRLLSFCVLSSISVTALPQMWPASVMVMSKSLNVAVAPEASGTYLFCNVLIRLLWKWGCRCSFLAICGASPQEQQLREFEGRRGSECGDEHVVVERGNGPAVVYVCMTEHQCVDLWYLARVIRASSAPNFMPKSSRIEEWSFISMDDLPMCGAPPKNLNSMMNQLILCLVENQQP